MLAELKVSLHVIQVPDIYLNIKEFFSKQVLYHWAAPLSQAFPFLR